MLHSENFCVRVVSRTDAGERIEGRYADAHTAKRHVCRRCKRRLYRADSIRAGQHVNGCTMRRSRHGTARALQDGGNAP